MANPTSTNVQNQALNVLRKEKKNITMFLMNGFQMRGRIKSFDDFCVVLTNDGKDNVIYKHAISTITPSDNINLTPNEGSEVK